MKLLDAIAKKVDKSGKKLKIGSKGKGKKVAMPRN
jgi:hypothetical protein